MKDTRQIPLLAAAAILLATPATAHWAARTHIHAHRWWVGATFPTHQTVVVRVPPVATVDFNVHPKTTRIFVDGTYRGTCDEFDGHPQRMTLASGRHQVRLVFPDGTELVRTIELAPGHELNINTP